MIFDSGHLIGDYEVIGPLGAGGMGAVYKVRHVISNRIEALKIIRADTSGPEMTERFLREIRLQAGLNHPNIASVHNAFRVDNELMMTVEFIEGVNLRDKLQPPGIVLGQAIQYAIQVLSALSYAHSRGVIHRDIKPSNVMIESNDVVKLLDFGLATSGLEPDLTQPGTMLGSPQYMSPEQVQGERLDGRSDLYSLGALLYELVTGRPPFDAPTAHAVIAGHLHRAPLPPVDCNPHVGADLSRIILKALAKNPEERPRTADEFRRALEAISLTETRTLATASPISPYGQPEIERASKDLATFIGPIANIVVRRAAAQCQTLGELYQRLSQEISSPANRQQFLAGMPGQSVSE
jgi:serine/threonine protein kinase